MPSKVEKFLRKLDAKRRTTLDGLLARIECGDFVSFDMKKLKGGSTRYRIRTGDIRIQFSLDETEKGSGN